MLYVFSVLRFSVNGIKMIDFDMQDTDSEYYSEDESETEVIIAHH